MLVAQLQLEQLDLAQIAADVARSVRESEGDRKVEMDIQGPMPVNADRRMLTIALDNLIGNAWKFTAERPDACITVGQYQRGGDEVFFVRDNGCGFDMRYVDKLFGVFQRLHHADEYEGTGIGLAIVKQFVEAQGGSVAVRSPEGGGTEFALRLRRASS